MCPQWERGNNDFGTGTGLSWSKSHCQRSPTSAKGGPAQCPRHTHHLSREPPWSIAVNYTPAGGGFRAPSHATIAVMSLRICLILVESIDLGWASTNAPSFPPSGTTFLLPTLLCLLGRPSWFYAFSPLLPFPFLFPVLPSSHKPSQKSCRGKGEKRGRKDLEGPNVRRKALDQLFHAPSSPGWTSGVMRFMWEAAPRIVAIYCPQDLCLTRLTGILCQSASCLHLPAKTQGELGALTPLPAWRRSILVPTAC